MANRTTDGFADLAADFAARFEQGIDAHWSDEEFSERALAAFQHQFAACAPYRAFCERKGISPVNVVAWDDVPPVPATAFKHFDFLSAPGPAEATFRTSGTTRGPGERGRHLVPSLDLYRASLMDPFRGALVPEHEPLTFVSLIPSPEDVPESSLSYMVGAAAERLASEVHWLVAGDGGWSEGAVEAGVASVRARREPVLLLGTALAFVHLIERTADPRGGGDDEAVRGLGSLPDGSRVMETGGFKGAGRVVGRDDLYDGISRVTGVPQERIVNEYGMTELLSQMYEPVLRDGPEAAGEHVPPPWLRARALDPVTLEPMPEDREGILAFFDLANLGSICHVLTEDVGSVVDGRIRLRGRKAGAEPRGCSRAMDELMAAAGRA